MITLIMLTCLTAIHVISEYDDIEGLVQDCSNSGVLAMELLH